MTGQALCIAALEKSKDKPGDELPPPAQSTEEEEGAAEGLRNKPGSLGTRWDRDTRGCGGPTLKSYLRDSGITDL